MGMVFGKIRVETRKYELVKKTADYEIRKYIPSVIAEITYDPTRYNNDKDAGFRILADYIGVFGKPQNSAPEKIAMTSPVITYSPEKIAMTAPVITSSGPEKVPEKVAMTSPVITSSDQETVTMGFILPEKYTRVEQAPKPSDERVKLREEGERKYGVVTFKGSTPTDVVAEKVKVLKEKLERDGFKVIGDFVLARYNPPWTLAPFRTNEVMLPVE